VYVFSDGRYAAQSRDFKFRLLSHEKGLIAHLSELGKRGGLSESDSRRKI
jgi:hypothetical protein